MVTSFKFTRPLTYELKANGDLVVSLDISTTEPDLVNDIVSEKFLKSMANQIKNRNLKLDIEHEAFRGDSTEEKEINKTKIPAGIMSSPVIKDYTNKEGEKHKTLNIKGKMNSHRKDFKQIKGSIVEGFLDAASIAFIPTESREITKDGKSFRVLEDGALLNVALTGNPINTGAQMRNIVSKSIDSIEEYKNAKLANPDIANKLEVKSRTTDRNRAVSEDEEEEEKKKKKLKSLPKDGAHAHTEADPLGEHKHPEIEEYFKSEFNYLENRISSLWKELFELRNNEVEEEANPMTSVKSHSQEKSNNNQKEVKNMSDETENETGQATEEGKKEEEVSAVEATTESAEKPSEEPVSEIKSMLGNVMTELKSISKRLKDLEEKDDDEEPTKPNTEAQSKAMMTKNDTQNLKAETKSVAGLAELQ